MHSSEKAIQHKKRAGAVDLYIASRLRLARKLAQMSQEEFAEQVGVTFQQIQKYETGVNRVSASRLYHIALIFSQPVSFFLPEAESEEASQGKSFPSELDQLMDLMRTPETLNLNTAFLRIKNSNVRRRVLALVRSIADESA